LGALYLLINSKNVKSLPIFTYVLFQNFHLFLINSFLAVYSTRGDELPVQFFSMSAKSGCFGFFDPSIAFIAFVPYGIFSSIMGSAGFIFCFLYFHPQVVSNTILLEPFIAQIFGYYLKIDPFPGTLTILGGISTIFGIYFINQGS